MKRRSFLQILAAAAVCPWELLKPKGYPVEHVPLWDVYPPGGIDCQLTANTYTHSGTITMLDLEHMASSITRYGPRERWVLCSPRFLQKYNEVHWNHGATTESHGPDSSRTASGHQTTWTVAGNRQLAAGSEGRSGEHQPEDLLRGSGGYFRWYHKAPARPQGLQDDRDRHRRDSPFGFKTLDLTSRQATREGRKVNGHRRGRARG